MKAKMFFFVLLISLLGVSQVKADTIYYQLPGTAQLCQDSLAMDTFVFYHPFPSSVVNWSISFNGGLFIPSGYGDSLLLIPTIVGNYTIVATYSGIPEPFTLDLYSEPPANANFTISGGGGYVNATNDTVWMCGNSVSVSSNTIGGEATSYHWYGPGGFYNTSNDPVIFSVPGMYYFERPNPCGITRDTFALVQPALMSPVWPSDTSFCNLPVSLTLDAGPGWFVYDWSTGETTQTIDVTAAGSYSVQLTNICTSGGATIVVEEQNYPLPDLYLYSTIPGTGMLCHYDTAILVPHDMHLYDTYQWYQGMGLIPISNQPTLLVDYILGSNYYAVEVSQGGCTAFADVGIGFYDNPWPTEMCVATYDPLLGINKVVFSHIPMPEDVEYILAYRQGANWVGIDTITTSSPEQILFDNISDPNQQSRTYTVFVRHQCGHHSQLTDWHKTIRVAIFQDVISQDYILQIMDGYQTMAGYEPLSYTILIDSLNNGNLVEIGILDGGNNSFTITNPVVGAAYYASANLPWSCGSKTTSTTLSNKRTFGTTDIAHNKPIDFSVYPNPANNKIKIAISETYYEIELINIYGQVLLKEHNSTEINVSEFSAGTYILKVKGENFSSQQIVIVY